jgi:hypothetical protein
VSLSFDPAEFSYITGPDSPSYGLLRMWSVFYSNATQRNIVGEALDFGAQTGASLEQRVARAADAIRFFIPTFKNELFAEEKEVRLIFTPAADAQVPHPDFRVARGMLVPYYRLHTLSGSPTVPGCCRCRPCGSPERAQGPERRGGAAAAGQGRLRQHRGRRVVDALPRLTWAYGPARLGDEVRPAVDEAGAACRDSRSGRECCRKTKVSCPPRRRRGRTPTRSRPVRDSGPASHLGREMDPAADP